MHTFKEFALLCHWLYDCRDCTYRRFHRMEGIYLFVLLHAHSERCSFIPTPINWGENNVTDSHIILHDIFWTINIKLVYANSIFSFHHLDDQSKNHRARHIWWHIRWVLSKYKNRRSWNSGILILWAQCCGRQVIHFLTFAVGHVKFGNGPQLAPRGRTLDTPAIVDAKLDVVFVVCFISMILCRVTVCDYRIF